MANDTVITVCGNLTADPELRFVPSGSAVASFTIASTPKTFDRQTNEFKDGEPLFLRSSVWREQAENVAETLTKGMRVIAQGYLKQRSYDKDGEKRTVYELEVQEVGPALRFASAKVTRTQRNGNGGGNRAPQPQQSAPQQNQPQQGGWNAPAADPWSTGGNNGGNGGGWGDPNQPPAY